MPGAAMPRVDETGVAAMRIGKGAAHPIFVRGHDDQMDMVGHRQYANTSAPA